MNLLSENIRHLRKKKGLTQEELGRKIGVNRAMIGSYEEGRAVPKLPLLRSLAYYFETTMDNLINTDMATGSSQPPGHTDIKGKELRVISTIVDKENKELITVVPIKATAGYLNGYADPEYIEKLPIFSLPLPELSQKKTYRVFQINGDSMEPIPSGAYIICEYVQDWEGVKDGMPYMLITQNEGITFKRVYNKIAKTGELLLKPDNPEYSPYTVNVMEIREVWKALGYISFNLPGPDDISFSKLSSMVMELKKDVENLKGKKPD